MSWSDVRGILWLIVFFFVLGVLFKMDEIEKYGVKAFIEQIWNGNHQENNK
jgi:hypothetical protein